ncbi:MAG: hypothetical protein IPK84_03105 [Candidatus Moraniibacteriota bacterium]|nr:MAG: hypothetical protein IPK84_03105 [Candidatus Moranbacteria bacterium]
MKSLANFLDSKYRQDAAPRKKASRAIDEKTVIFLAPKSSEEEYGNRGVASVVPRSFDGRKILLSCKSSLWVEEMGAFRNDFLRRLTDQGADVVVDMKASNEYGRG